ncbi:hypothetical protein ACRALDRAFT_2096962 [Sodiomyces alcalophilus JCM 7366]|uniref:uncharacterized protein n=1 Tax=Sodiomyces alcalophilus JCM 7366 TaxID=591952 RepID=UPI0039B60FA4
MSNNANSQPSRFTPQNQTPHERLASNTVGLVALSDFRKRRAEALEQQEREAHEAALVSGRASALATPDRSQTATPNNAAAAATSDSGEGGPARPAKKKKKRTATHKLSFAGEEDEEVAEEKKAPRSRPDAVGSPAGDSEEEGNKPRVIVNTSVGIIPKPRTKAALRREAAEREALRREFLAIQEAVKNTEVAIPFVFHDGTDIPGGMVRVKKGDHIWLFLDKTRKVGADLGVGGKKWARIGVDDLMLVRGSVIIPHHYDFYFFIINKTPAPGNRRLFDYSAEAPATPPVPETDRSPSVDSDDASTKPPRGGLTTAAALKAAAALALPNIKTLEGAGDEPSFTKVVDRRWYERNKHIYPASTWQEFDPEKDHESEVRRDQGGNTFFYSR